MADFAAQLKAFTAKVERRRQFVFTRVVELVYESVVLGSGLTGAPGQPVDTGALRASWSTQFLSPTLALVSTGIDYAIYIEDNPRGVTFRNHGPHSVKLTRAGFDRIVAQANAEAQRVA